MESTQIARFPGVVRTLEAAGWFRGRQIEDSRLEQWCAFRWKSGPGYCTMFPSAMRVLREFGDLKFFQDELVRRGRTYAIEPFSVDPLSALGRRDSSWTHYQWQVEDHLYPLGAYGDIDVLAVTPRGYVYSLGDGVSLVGINFDHALTNLITGLMPLDMEQLEAKLVGREFSWPDLVEEAVERILPTRKYVETDAEHPPLQ